MTKYTCKTEFAQLVLIISTATYLGVLQRYKIQSKCNNFLEKIQPFKGRGGNRFGISYCHTEMPNIGNDTSD